MSSSIKYASNTTSRARRVVEETSRKPRAHRHRQEPPITIHQHPPPRPRVPIKERLGIRTSELPHRRLQTQTVKFKPQSDESLLTQISNLKRIIHQKTQENESLNNSINVKDKAVSMLKDEAQMLKEQMDRAKANETVYADLYKDEKIKAKTATERVNELDTSSHKLEDEVTRLKSELLKSNDKLVHGTNALQASNRKLLVEIADLRNANTGLKSIISATETISRRKDEEISELTMKWELAESNCVQLASTSNVLLTSLQNAKLELEQKERLLKESEEKEANFIVLSNIQSNQIKDLTLELNSKNQILEENKKVISDLQGQLEKKVADLKTQISNIEDYKSNAQKSKSILESKSAEITKLKSELETQKRLLGQEKQSNSEQMKVFQTQIEQMKSELMEMEKNDLDKNAKFRRTKTKEIEQEIQTKYKNIIANLQLENNRLSNEIKQNDTNLVKKLQVMTEQNNKKMEENIKKIQQLEKELADKAKALVASEMKRQHLDDDFNANSIILAHERELVQRKNLEIAKLTNNLSNSNLRVHGVEADLQELKNSLELKQNLISENNNVITELTLKLQSERTDFLTTQSLLNFSISNLEKKVKELEAREPSNHEIQTKDNIIHNLNHKISIQKEELAKLSKINESLNEKLGKMSELESQIKFYKQKLDKKFIRKEISTIRKQMNKKLVAFEKKLSEERVVTLE